ncbi:MAG TPA: hypothetical protein V6D33_05020, partial [Cyanophyceae cyanobacterium]
MTVVLEIKDGNPNWYLSPDIWTVPTDPEGAMGLPVVGKPCYLWARVHNKGEERAENATVRFYWANPAVGIDRNTANLVGTAAVTLDGGQTSDVLCLSPWIPTFVNQGHECVLAEVFQASRDPLPNTPVFNVPTDRHVAQRNLSVLMTSGGRFHFAFEVHNTVRKARNFTVNFKEGKLAELEPLVPLLGRGFKLPQERGQIQKPGFVRSSCPGNQDLEGEIPHVCGLELAP